MKKQDAIEAFLDIRDNKIKISNKGNKNVYIRTSIFINDDNGWIIEENFIPIDNPPLTIRSRNHSRWHKPNKIFGKTGTKVRVILEQDKEEFVFPQWTEYEKRF
jgi:hypothetical protein